jgi:hypothetical protein
MGRKSSLLLEREHVDMKVHENKKQTIKGVILHFQ